MRGSLRPREHDEDRFDRTKRIGWIDMDSLSRTRCLVVGAGALGNEVVKDLVLSGFRRIAVVDMDRVVKSNLNRCVFFREEDSKRGLLKAEILADRAEELDASIKVERFVSRIEELDDAFLRTYSIAFGCLDNVAARLHLNAHAFHLGIAYIDGGTSGMAGRIQVVTPPSSPCLQCGMNKTHYKIMDDRHSCTGNEVSYYQPRMPAEITTTSVVAAIQVREALKIVSGKEQSCVHHVLHYNGMTNSCDVLELTVDPQCPMHSSVLE
jgi:molybdopterin/thiamine biosynthesis adenylyltransferase